MIGLGQKVRIARANKNDCFPKLKALDAEGYEIDGPSYVGQVGEVVRREFGSGPLPVGESPTDPLYIVKTPIGTDAFWSEEIEVVK
jgi:hypothetical protein